MKHQNTNYVSRRDVSPHPSGVLGFGWGARPPELACKRGRVVGGVIEPIAAKARRRCDACDHPLGAINDGSARKTRIRVGEKRFCSKGCHDLALTKLCSACGVEKRLYDFYESKRDGKERGVCKDCTKAAVKANRLSKIDYYRERERERKRKSKV